MRKVYQDLFPFEGKTSDPERNNIRSIDDGGSDVKSKDELLMEERKSPYALFLDTFAVKEAVSYLTEKDKGILDGKRQRWS